MAHIEINGLTITGGGVNLIGNVIGGGDVEIEGDVVGQVITGRRKKDR